LLKHVARYYEGAGFCLTLASDDLCNKQKWQWYNDTQWRTCAGRRNANVLSCDSVQVSQRLSVRTTRPSWKDLHKIEQTQTWTENTLVEKLRTGQNWIVSIKDFSSLTKQAILKLLKSTYDW